MSERCYFGTRKGVFIFDRAAGGRWESRGAPAFLGAPVSMLLDDPRDGRVYAALNHGHFGAKLHASDDRGKSWREITVPAFDKDEPGRIPIRDGMTSDKPPTVVQIWAMEAGGAQRPGELWIGTIPGGLFRSADGGNSWQLVRSLWERPERMQWFGGGADLPGIHSVCVDPRDSRHVSVGISCGGMWSTFDGGESWECRTNGMRADYMPPDRKYDPNIQDPHRVVQCASAPERLWAQHHNGIFRSVDAGKNWTAVEPKISPDFGFAVVVDPHDGESAWFVPGIKDEVRVPKDGKVIVTRTRDGGRTFEALSAGLPQENAYDLVYRHAMDIDETGRRLVFGSTTGGAWVSENAGDSWNEIPARLPPVYCVRFATAR